MVGDKHINPRIFSELLSHRQEFHSLIERRSHKTEMDEGTKCTVVVRRLKEREWGTRRLERLKECGKWGSVDFRVCVLWEWVLELCEPSQPSKNSQESTRNKMWCGYCSQQNMCNRWKGIPLGWRIKKACRKSPYCSPRSFCRAAQLYIM